MIGTGLNCALTRKSNHISSTNHVRHRDPLMEHRLDLIDFKSGNSLSRMKVNCCAETRIDTEGWTFHRRNSGSLTLTSVETRSTNQESAFSSSLDSRPAAGTGAGCGPIIWPNEAAGRGATITLLLLGDVSFFLLVVLILSRNR